jgi:uncharacterized protein YjbJ (UPF0337 family)
LNGITKQRRVRGKFDRAKGAAKETVGRAVNDRELEQEGRSDQAGGKIQEGFGTARRKVGEAVEDIGEAIRK